MNSVSGISELLMKLRQFDTEQNKAPILFRLMYEIVIECLKDCELYRQASLEGKETKYYEQLLEVNMKKYKTVLYNAIITLLATEMNSPSSLSSEVKFEESDRLYVAQYLKGAYDNFLSGYVGKDKDIDLNKIIMAYNIVKEIPYVEEAEDKEVEEVIEKEQVQDVDSTNKLDEIKEVWGDTIYQEVQRILEIYQNLFKSGMEIDKPIGVLVPDGYRAYIKDRGIGRGKNNIFSKLYSVLEEMIGSENLVIPVKNKDIHLKDLESGSNYYVDLQVRNLFGVYARRNANGQIEDKMSSNWNEFESHIGKVIENMIYQGLLESDIEDMRDVDRLINRMRTALTTCIAITEYDKATCMKLRIYANGKAIDLGVIENAIKSGKLFSGKGKVKLFTETGGVYTIAIVFDEVLNSQRPLFAFQAIETLVERGEKLSWKNVVLGRDVDKDTIYTIDFTNNALFNCVIGAGQRSGKGVMTLNILGAAFAEKFPIFYADGKPEMGRMLWQLGEKYQVPVLALDCMESNPKYIDLVGKGLPSGLGGKKAVALTIAYIKMLQLSVIFANTRNLGINFDVPGFDSSYDRAVFVFDEALAFKGTIANTRKAIKTAESLLDSKEDKELKRVYKGILGWIDTANLDFRSSLMSQMPKSAMNLFWLNQNMTAEWKVEDNDFVSNAVRSTSTCRILGNGMVGQYFGLPNTKKLADYVNMTERCFGFYTGLNRPEEDKVVKLFKPYLVLPSSQKGDDSRCVEQLENNTPDKILMTIRDDEGNYREDIGFEGIIKLIANGDETAIPQALRKSYDVAYKLLSMAGLLDNYNAPYDEIVYHYFYDSAPERLMSTGDIVEAIRLGGIDKLNSESGALDMVVEGEEEDTVLSSVSSESEPVDYSGLYASQNEPQEEMYFNIGKDRVKVENVKEVVNERDPFGNLDKRGSIGSIEESELEESTDYQEEWVENLQGEIGKAQDTLEGLNLEDDTKEEFRQQLNNILNSMYMIPPNSKYDEKGRSVYEGSDAEELTRDNSIDCSEAVNIKLAWMDKMLNQSQQGCLLYINKLWKVILDEACNIDNGGIRKELVAKVGLYGGNLYLNGRLVNLNGILGGSNGVELANIVNFQILFKKFQGMTELQIDDEMMQALLSDCDGVGDIKAPFALCPRLRMIQYLSGGKIHMIKRQEALTEETGRALNERRQAVQVERMNFLSGRQNIAKSWKETTEGKKVWGASQARKLLGSSASALEKKNGKRKFGKGIAYGGLAVMTGIVGGGAYLVYNGAKAIRRSWKGYN